MSAKQEISGHILADESLDFRVEELVAIRDNADNLLHLLGAAVDLEQVFCKNLNLGTETLDAVYQLTTTVQDKSYLDRRLGGFEHGWDIFGEVSGIAIST